MARQGNGSGIIKPAARLVRGTWNPLGGEILRPSYTTKLELYLSRAMVNLLVHRYCLLAATLLAAFPEDATYVVVAGLFLTMKVLLPLPIFTQLLLHRWGPCSPSRSTCSPRWSRCWPPP